MTSPIATIEIDFIAKAAAARKRIAEAGQRYQRTQKIERIERDRSKDERGIHPSQLRMIADNDQREPLDADLAPIYEDRARMIALEVARHYRVDPLAMLHKQVWEGPSVERLACQEAMYRSLVETPLTIRGVAKALGRVPGRHKAWKASLVVLMVLRHHARTGAPLPDGAEWSIARRFTRRG